MHARSNEAGFTLIDVLLATALFVFVAAAGFEVLRALGGNVVLLAQRADAATQLGVASATMRSDALSALAIWKPPSTCGDAVELLQRDAGGTSFIVYAERGGALVRAIAAGPLDPCAANLTPQTLVPTIAGLTVTPVAAAALPAHTDPISGATDGGLFVAAGITDVAADSHATGLSGAPIESGNDVVEVTIDADPVVTPIDLVAGNRPSAYTHVLAYTCNGRCEATAPFPEIRGGAYIDCTAGYDFQNTPAYYVPASYGFTAGRVVITAYELSAGYTFTFAGATPVTAERAWGVALWPPAGSPLAGTIADPYPLDYTNNAVAARGAAQLAADLGEPATFASELDACADMHADRLYHD